MSVASDVDAGIHGQLNISNYLNVLKFEKYSINEKNKQLEDLIYKDDSKNQNQMFQSHYYYADLDYGSCADYVYKVEVNEYMDPIFHGKKVKYVDGLLI